MSFEESYVYPLFELQLATFCADTIRSSLRSGYSSAGFNSLFHKVSSLGSALAYYHRAYCTTSFGGQLMACTAWSWRSGLKAWARAARADGESSRDSLRSASSWRAPIGIAWEHGRLACAHCRGRGRGIPSRRQQSMVVERCVVERVGRSEGHGAVV